MADQHFDPNLSSENNYNQQIETLGLTYQLVTKRTSFVAVEESLSRDPATNQLVKQHIANQASTGTMGFPKTATSSTLTALLGLLFLCFAAVITTGGFKPLANAMHNMYEELAGKEYIENYIHTMAHELKSPLTGIIASSELLQQNLPTISMKAPRACQL